MKLNKAVKNNLLTTLFKSYIFQCGVVSVIIIVFSNFLGMLLQWLLSKFVPDYYLFYRSLYLGVAALNFLAAVKSAYLNVKINLPGIKEQEIKRRFETVDGMIREAEALAEKIYTNVLGAL